MRVAGVDVGADGEEEDEEDDDGRYHTPLRLHADDAEGGGDGAEAVVAAVRALEGKVAAFEAAAATARARSAAAAALEEEEARLRGRVDELEAALAAAVAALAAARNNSEDEEKEKNAGVVEERSQAVDAATRRAEAAEAAATAARESLQVPPAGPCLAIAPFSYTRLYHVGGHAGAARKALGRHAGGGRDGALGPAPRGDRRRRAGRGQGGGGHRGGRAGVGASGALMYMYALARCDDRCGG